MPLLTFESLSPASPADERRAIWRQWQWRQGPLVAPWRARPSASLPRPAPPPWRSSSALGVRFSARRGRVHTTHRVPPLRTPPLTPQGTAAAAAGADGLRRSLWQRGSALLLLLFIRCRRRLLGPSGHRECGVGALPDAVRVRHPSEQLALAPAAGGFRAKVVGLALELTDSSDHPFLQCVFVS